MDPRMARLTVDKWCQTWLTGYRSRRSSTVRQAEVHIKLIKAAFGSMPLSAVQAVRRPVVDSRTEVCWKGHVLRLRAARPAVADLQRRSARRRDRPQPVLETHLAADRSQRPTSRPPSRCGLCTAHSNPGCNPAMLLGAFAGLRLAEAAALRAEDVDFMRGIVSPTIQWPSEPLKSETSRTPIPIPRELALLLSAALSRSGGNRSSPTRLAGPLARGRSNAPFARPAPASSACRASSGSTTSGTTSPACSSPTGWT